jgi:hypothetical protein
VPSARRPRGVICQELASDARPEERDTSFRMEAIIKETTWDALVAEALGPDAASAANVASVRALSDLTIWQALRDRGLSPEASVDQAAATVERWLEARVAGSLRST